MAIDNEVYIEGVGTYLNKSVSFNSTAGDSSSFRSVPDGEVWDLRALRFTHTEPSPVGIDFVITDGATDVAVLTTGVGEVQAVTTHGWQGSIIVPGGWRIYARFHGMIGGYSDNNWQYIAIKLDAFV